MNERCFSVRVSLAPPNFQGCNSSFLTLFIRSRNKEGEARVLLESHECADKGENQKSVQVGLQKISFHVRIKMLFRFKDSSSHGTSIARWKALHSLARIERGDKLSSRF